MDYHQHLPLVRKLGQVTTMASLELPHPTHKLDHSGRGTQTDALGCCIIASTGSHNRNAMLRDVRGPYGSQSSIAAADSWTSKVDGKVSSVLNIQNSDLVTNPTAKVRPPPMLLLQPETRAISQTQLIFEVRSIYTGLVLVENKCKKVDGEQKIAALEKDLSKRTTLSTKQYQALIALHKTLLHEHHDFFLANQHPSGSTALKRVAEKNSMPARLWQYGIHGFLEVLRYRLPESLEHMMAWIYIAFSMMSLLYETVPMFEETWVECLGDLGRYRMAVEDSSDSDRQTWSGVSRYWFHKASDTNPPMGRLRHHLAILSKNFSYEQLSLYLRALTCENEFDGARTSVLKVFNPMDPYMRLAEFLDLHRYCCDLSGQENSGLKPYPSEQSNFWSGCVSVLDHIIVPDIIMLQYKNLQWIKSDRTAATIDYPAAPTTDIRPLPEDWMIRGIIWTKYFFPTSFLDTSNEFDDSLDKKGQMCTSANIRIARIRWLASQLIPLRAIATVTLIRDRISILFLEQSKAVETLGASASGMSTDNWNLRGLGRKRYQMFQIGMKTPWIRSISCAYTRTITT